MNYLKLTKAKELRYSYVLYVGIFLTVVLLSSCLADSDAETIAEDAPVIRPVLTEVVGMKATDKLSFTGVVQATNRADLSFRISGHLTEVLVNEGDQVSAGQLLATLQSKDAQLAVNAAQLELDNTRAEYNRAKVLFEQSQAISRADMDQLTTRYQLAENRLNEATQQLQYTRLVAPFDGLVGQRMLDNHVQVQANETVLMVHDINDLEVAIQVPAHVMTAGHESAHAIAELSVFPTERFALSVKSYATQADPATQTYSVILSFDDLAGRAILPGMTARVVPTADPKLAGDYVVVPLTAVSPNNLGQQYVWVIDDNNLIEQRFVETGALYGDRIAVTGNLSAGERIAIAGAASLQAGMQVRPITVDASKG